jgi:hemoglobin-like flavoprotein
LQTPSTDTCLKKIQVLKKISSNRQEYPKTIFKNVTSIRVQGRKLTSILDVVVKSATNLDEVIEAVKQLGVRHVAYGVDQKDQYMVVAEALLFALKTHLGNDWTKEVEKAWTDTYLILMDVMLKASDESKKSK